MDDFVLSVNTIFLQTIAHMDAAGCSGNLLDVLEVMASPENRQAYEDPNWAGVGVALAHQNATHPKIPSKYTD